MDFSWDRTLKSEAIKSLTSEVIRSFSISAPSKSIPRLLKLRTAISQLEDEYWKKVKMNIAELGLPGIDLYNLYQYLIIFFIASLRISSFLISAPFFSSSGFPIQIRIVASISITAFLFPVLKVPDILQLEGFNLFLLIIIVLVAIDVFLMKVE